MRKSGKSRILRTLANNWFVERDSYNKKKGKKREKEEEKKHRFVGRKGRGKTTIILLFSSMPTAPPLHTKKSDRWRNRQTGVSRGKISNRTLPYDWFTKREVNARSQ